MTRRSSRSLLVSLGALILVAPASPARAYWGELGAGAGAGAAAMMPAGNQPSGSVSGQTVTVSWPQSSFLASTLGSYGGGGYAVRRYATGSSIAVTPNASCDTTINGAGATLQCVEAGVPFGSWQYAVRPVLNTFTGAESAKSAAVGVATPAPLLSTAIAQNPTAAQTTGDVQLSWAVASGATGYNVYRRTSGGSYDFASPRNGATPIGSAITTYADAGAGLAPSATYDYVVRAVAGSPAVESASSNQKSAATISRPAAPGSVSATAAVAARIDVGWSAVAGVTGYNVYRRTAAGSYNFASPLNGATPLAALTYADLIAVNATSYFYSVRSVISGLGGAQVESASTESDAATADSTPPPAPTAVSVTSGGTVLSVLTCAIAAGTRYINGAGAPAVGVSATIATPETGEAVVFAATSGATATATVAAGSTTVTTALNVLGLTDGAVTLTARTKDLAGNLSATIVPPNAIVKDTVVPALVADFDDGVLGLDPRVFGTAECRAAIHIVKTFGGNVGKAWDATAGAGSPFSFSADVEGPLLGLGQVSYDVTATDRAGNTGTTVGVGG